MSVISMTEASLPPGFRFHPTDDELVLDYLYHKLTGGGVYGGGGGVYGGVAMFDVDLNKCEPWDLPDAACVGGRDWYFFSLHDRKYATGRRTNRATRSGYWKATGKDRAIVTRRRGNAGVGGEAAVVGMRKTLVFYQGRAPRGTKTEWVMHEFRMEGLAVADHPTSSSSSNLKEEDWVLCRVFYKSGTSTPRPASDEVTGALSSEVSSPPASVLPVDAIFGSYYEQDSGQYHRPATAALPMRSPSSYMDLLSSMLHGGSDGANTEEGYLVQQSAMSQTWNLF